MTATLKIYQIDAFTDRYFQAIPRPAARRVAEPEIRYLQPITRSMKTYFEELFEYNHHFNQKLAEILRDDHVSDRAIKLFSHILNANHIWNHRIEDKKPVYGVWQIQPAADLAEIDRVNYAASLAILDTTDLTKEVRYANTRGESYVNSARDILFHIINHSTYHRAQIATEFKQNGLDPLVTDYVFYKRS